MSRLLPGIGRNLFQRNGLLVLARRLQSTQPAVTSTDCGDVAHPEIKVTNLENGLRVASENTGAPTCTVGLYVNAGSRFEISENNGSAHFLEQMAFKGTEKLSQLCLEQDVENMGAQLSSSISREHTSFFGKCFNQDMSRMVDILMDATHNSTLNDASIDEQRKIILSEMDELETNNQQDVVMDYLHSTAYQGTPLGLTVQGPTENVMNFNRSDLEKYRNEFYSPSRMVLAAAGGVDHDKLVDLAKQFYSTDVTQKTMSRQALSMPCRYTGSDLRHRADDLPVAYVAMAIEGVGLGHIDFLPLQIAAQVIGEWDETSINSQHFPNPLVRRMANEGLCKSFHAFNRGYSDTGLWGLFFASDNDHIHDCTVRMQDEWMRLCIRLTDFDVSRAKNTLITKLALSLDGTTSQCNEIGRQMLLEGYRTPFHKLAKDIQEVDTNDIRRVMNQYVWDTCPAVASKGPVEALPHYANMRAKMYKVFY